jgi:protein involved in polysaccharide export with SLBB domain
MDDVPCWHYNSRFSRYLQQVVAGHARCPAGPRRVWPLGPARSVFSPRLVIVSFVRFRQLALAVCFGTAAQPAGAQPPQGQASSRTAAASFESRDELTARLRRAEAQNQTAQAWLLRSRLERGDFQEGDKIVVVIDGAAVVRDTIQVRAGKVLQFPRMAEVSLQGVLRAELTEVVTDHLARYLVNPSVRATPLLPVAVLGSITRPGFYYTAADVVLRDVIMSAGGPTYGADLDKVVVRRGGEVIWAPSDVRVALADGLSLDELHLRAGDEIVIPERRRFQLTTVLGLVSTAMGVTLVILQLLR